jgi:hypothetical protein
VSKDTMKTVPSGDYKQKDDYGEEKKYARHDDKDADSKNYCETDE